MLGGPPFSFSGEDILEPTMPTGAPALKNAEEHELFGAIGAFRHPGETIGRSASIMPAVVVAIFEDQSMTVRTFPAIGESEVVKGVKIGTGPLQIKFRSSPAVGGNTPRS